MERLDDERPLARVTYLPGVKPVEVEVPETPLPMSSSGRSGFSERPDLSRPDLSEVWAPVEEVLDDAPPVTAARHVSITALARRGLSRRELERLLDGRDFEADDIANEMARLEREGYIDDIALAQNLVGTLQERKGLGRSSIAAELTRRLLAPAAIEYALELIDSGDELSRARDLALKRVGQLRGLDRDTAVRRLSGFLARRGYGGSTIRAVVDQVLPLTPRRGVAFR